MLDIEIDGKQIQVPPGSTIMDAARQLGTYIPHFCYHKKLSIAANCRMCLVEVEKAPKPLPACATPVTNGMKVFTHSKLAVEAQKSVMEFLLLNHPLDCPICDQGGECQLQDLAVGYGSSGTRFQEAKQVVFQKNVGSLISMQEMSRCIYCTRCVRFGQEIAGIMELGMANRNVHSEILTFMGRSVDSELSGNMIDLCPVGALTSRPFRYSARGWELTQRKSISPHDSLGSNLIVQVKGNRVMRVLPNENEEINETWISDKDRFSYEGLNSVERLTRPMIRVDGALREVEWNVALDYVAHALKDVKATHGADAMASLASPHATLEEIFLLKQLTQGIGSAHFDFRPRQRDFSLDKQRKGALWLGMKIAEIRELDAVLVVGSFLRKDHPLFAQRLRQIAKKSAKVSLLSVTQNNPLIKLHRQMAASPAALPARLAAIVKAAAQLKNVAISAGLENIDVCADSQAIAESLVSGSKQAVFLGNVAEQSPLFGQIYQLAGELASITGARLGVIGEAANSVGGYLAGGVSSGLNAYEMFAEPRKAYVLLGVEPEFDCHNPQMAVSAIKSAAFSVLLTPFKSAKTMEYIDALLPISPFTETSGTFVNTEGRIQSFNGVSPALEDSRPGWKVLRVLGNLLDLQAFEYTSSEAVRDALLDSGQTFAVGLDNGLTHAASSFDMTPVQVPLQRIADVPIYFADPLVRRGAALQRTSDAAEPAAYMNQALLEKIAVNPGESVRIRQDNGEAVLTAALEQSLPAGCVRIAAAHEKTSMLGEMFGSLTMERV